MKKFIITMAILAAAAGSAMAQVNLGAGYINQTTVTKVSNTQSKALSNGFYAGASYEMGLGSGFAFEPGVYYNYLFSKDFESSIASAEVSTTSHYLAVPLQFSFSYSLLPALDVFAYAGPQLKLGLASKSKASASILGNSAEHEVDNYGENSSLNRFDLGMGIGLGADICDMVRVKVGYNWGLLDLNSNDNVTMHNNELVVGVAFLF